MRATSSSGEGYVEYLWQWEDEEDNIVPKLSFVTLFAAWDWIIGTGVYLDDVNAEISSLTNKIVLVVTGVSAILAVLLAFMVRQGLAAERARRAAESDVRESRERYRVLVEASREAARSALRASGSDWAALEETGGTVTRIVHRNGLDTVLDDELSSTLARVSNAESIDE